MSDYYINPNILNVPLSAVVAGVPSNDVILLSQAVTTWADVITYKLGVVPVDASPAVTVQAGDLGGRKVTLTPDAGGTATADGLATHWAWADPTSSRQFICVGTLANPQQLTNGNPIVLDPFDIEFCAPVEFTPESLITYWEVGSLNLAFGYLTTHGLLIVLGSDLMTTPAEVVAYRLGSCSRTFGAQTTGDLPGGWKLPVLPGTGTVELAGIATHWALIQTADNTPIVSGPLAESQLLTVGNDFELPDFDIEFAPAQAA